MKTNKYDEAIEYLTPIFNSASDKMNYGKMLTTKYVGLLICDDCADKLIVALREGR